MVPSDHYLSRCKTNTKVHVLLGMQGKRRRPIMVRGKVESPPRNNPRVPYPGSGDNVMDWKKSSLPYKLGRLGFIY